MSRTKAVVAGIVIPYGLGTAIMCAGVPAGEWSPLLIGLGALLQSPMVAFLLYAGWQCWRAIE